MEHRQAAESISDLMIGQLRDHSLGDLEINIDGAQSCPFCVVASALRGSYRSEFGNTDNLARQH